MLLADRNAVDCRQYLAATGRLNKHSAHCLSAARCRDYTVMCNLHHDIKLENIVLGVITCRSGAGSPGGSQIFKSLNGLTVSLCRLVDRRVLPSSCHLGDSDPGDHGSKSGRDPSRSKVQSSYPLWILVQAALPPLPKCIAVLRSGGDDATDTVSFLGEASPRQYRLWCSLTLVLLDS